MTSDRLPSNRLGPLWQRDLLHLLVGSALGLSVGLVVLRFAPREGPADEQRFGEVHDWVQQAYVREVDERKLIDDALRGMVESLDAYSRYYTREELQAMDRETSGHYRGIGVVFTRPVEERRVLFALPGSPAERAGIGTGDRFVAIDGRRLDALDPGEIQHLLTETEADSIELVVAGRDGRERSVQLERTDLVDPTVRHAQLLDEDLGLGYLAITAFSQETPNEFDLALRDLERRGLRALVVDVRGNLGGVLRSAVTLVNRFVSDGPIVSQEGRGEPIHYEAKASEAWYEGLPLVVLVDGESASASEVFAAALQEYRAAVVVGSPSYGKGMVQQVRTFDGQGAVKLTTAYYYTPSGRNLERTVEDAWETGVVPDLQVALNELESRLVHRHLASYGPPPEALDAIRAWEREEGRELLPRRPPDPQLDAALALFQGERPGAYATERAR
jgi:carboxyl-terminal processing protease